ncbi:UNVERIFIED_CONTAM: hypothetical protein RMT77_011821 [Armadillidium vulgare]
MALGDQSKENLLHISWCDSRCVPVLNASNILDYFTERSNPFYHKDCNNEFLKMQQNTRIEGLQHMQGVEYMLLHAQDPILYIIRKQHRYSPTQVSPLACYHIIAGQVFQTPDVGSVINSRLVSSVNHLNSAFSELQSFSQYHPSRGYWWQTPKQNQDTSETQKTNNEKKGILKDEVASVFQRRRVDLLLNDLAQKFPYKLPIQQQTQQAVTGGQETQTQPPSSQNAESVKTEESKPEPAKTEIKTEIKTEPKTENSVQPPPPPQRVAKPPPEKRQKIGP